MTTPFWNTAPPMPPKMPHPNDDPAHLAARQAAATYTDTAKTARGTFGISDLDKAQRITDAYTTYCSALEAARLDLHGRRRARMEALEKLIPIGPGIPTGTTPADKAVLMAAFRNAYDKAAASTPAQLGTMLTDAERFDDDAMRRAVLTVATDTGQISLLKGWSDQHIDLSGHLAEITELRAAFSGIGVSAGFERRDFTPMRRPNEAAQLPQLAAAHERAIAAFNNRNR